MRRCAAAAAAAARGRPGGGCAAAAAGLRRRAAAPAAAGDDDDEIVIHCAGPDRRGLLAELTSAAAKAGGDIRSSRATILGNQFSMMMVVYIPEGEAQLARLKSGLRNVQGLETWQRAGCSANKAPTYLRPGRKVRVLKLTGMNTNGIVNGVCGLFSQRGVNLINFASEMAPAPFTDDPMFKLSAVLDMPEKMEEEDLEQGLDALAQVLGIDMWVEGWQTAELAREA